MTEKTSKVVDAASQVKQQGATGAYTREFEIMKTRVDEVNRLLESSSVSSSDLDDLNRMIDERRCVKHVNLQPNYAFHTESLNYYDFTVY